MRPLGEHIVDGRVHQFACALLELRPEPVAFINVRYCNGAGVDTGVNHGRAHSRFLHKAIQPQARARRSYPVPACGQAENPEPLQRPRAWYVSEEQQQKQLRSWPDWVSPNSPP